MTEKEVAPESTEQENNQNENNEEETELESAIIRQVEYYFGDLNLPRDKFLREQVKLDDGWVPLDVLIRFNRLAKLTKDLDVIANALNKSAGLVEVSEDNKKVRRNPELPVPEMNEERRKELQSRTVYAKGFNKDTTLDEIMKFFKQYDEFENIVMRRYLDRNSKERIFKGSVFVTFKTKEQADKFFNTKDLKFGDKDLIVIWQDKYLQQKQEEYAALKEKKEQGKNKKKAEEAETKEEFKLPTGTVLYFSQGAEGINRENVKEAITGLGGDVAFIDYAAGNPEGWVRLAKEDTAKGVAEKITDGKLKIADIELTFKLLEGDEEKAYLEKTISEMAKRRQRQKNFGKNNKGRNFKGKNQGGRKRKQESRDDEPRSKVKAIES